MQKKVDKVLKFNHIDNIIDVNPAQLVPPFIRDDFNNFVRQLSNELKDPSLSETAIQIISSYLIYIYPDKLNPNYDLVSAALYIIANEYLQSKDAKDIQELCIEKDLNEEELELLIVRIKDAMDNF